MNKDEKIILNSFPKHLRNDVLEILKVFPLKSELSDILSPDQFNIKIDNETIKIPFRVYFDAPDKKTEAQLSSTQKEIISCLLTRHHNGKVREEYLRRIFLSKNKWVIPFVFQLIGEYVVEILNIIYDNLQELDVDSYVSFLKQNDYFYNLTKQRVISYWDCYYRYISPKREGYVGEKIIKFFDEKLKEYETK